MKKIFKKSLSLAISVVLAFSVFGGAISINAETPENYYGTPENGYNSVNAGDFLALDPAAAPMNLNFTDGFTYWSAKSNMTGSASDMMTLRTENGATYLEPKFGENAIVRADGNEDNTVWAGVATTKFKIPGVKVGDRINLMLDIKMNVTSGAPLNVNIRQFTPDGNLAGIGGMYDETLNAIVGKIEYTFNYAWNSTAVAQLAGSYKVNDTTTITNKYLTVVDPDASFSIQIQDGTTVAQAKAATSAPFSVSNVRVVVLNETEEELYTNLSSGKQFPTYTTYTNGATPETRYYNGTLEGGTVEDGYTIASDSLSNIYRYGILDEPKNLNFSEGLKYWGPNGAGASPSDFVTIQDGVANFKPKTSKAGFVEGITSQKFRLKGVAAGEKIRFYAEYNYDETKTRDFIYRVNTFTGVNANGEVINNKLQGDTTPSTQPSLFCQNNTNYTSTVAGDTSADPWKMLTVDVTVANPDDIYSLLFTYYNAAIDVTSTYSVRNIHIFKVLSDGAYIDLMTGEKITTDFQPFGGTTERGIETVYHSTADFNHRRSRFNGTSYAAKDILGTDDNFKNGGFTQGFKYWMIREYSDKYPDIKAPADYAEIKEENGEKYIKFDSIPVAADGTKFNKQFTHVPFYIKGLKAGDTLIAKMDIRNAATANSTQLLLEELKEHNTSPIYYYNSAGSTRTNQSSNTSATDWKTIVTPAYTVVDGSKPFLVYIYQAQLDSAEFKNICIYKTNATTGEITEVSIGYSPDNNYNKDGGTAEKGMCEWGTYVQNATATNRLLNADFSQGLKYWAPKNSSSCFTSDVAQVQADGKLLVTKITASEGVQTAPITFDSEHVGKKAVLIAQVDRITSNFEFAVYENGAKIYTLSRGYSSNFSFPIEEVKADAKYTFEFKATGTVGTQFAISNVHLFFTQTHLNATSYIDFDGNHFFGPEMGYMPFGGTEENGIVVPSSGVTDGAGIIDGSYFVKSYQYIPANKGFKNGDFSEGFKYWACRSKNSDTTSLSIQGTVDKEAGIMSFNAGYTGLYKGMYSQIFTLENDVKVGDVLYASVDARKTIGGIQVGLIGFYKTATGYSGPTISRGNSVYATSQTDWTTIYSSGFTIDDVNTYLSFDVQRHYEEGQGELSNCRVLRADRGGLAEAPKVNIDGTLIDASLYGDANNDGAVNLIDIVRMKREAAYGEYNDFGIFLAAVDLDNDDTIGATDFTAVIGKVLDPAIVIAK